MNRTLYDKLVDAHKVSDLPDGDQVHQSPASQLSPPSSFKNKNY